MRTSRDGQYEVKITPEIGKHTRQFTLNKPEFIHVKTLEYAQHPVEAESALNKCQHGCPADQAMILSIQARLKGGN